MQIPSIDIYSTDDLHRFCENMRQSSTADADALAALAPALHKRLKLVAPGAPILFGIDSSRAARMVTRHIDMMASLSETIGKAAGRCYADYVRYIYNPLQQPAGSSTFKV